MASAGIQFRAVGASLDTLAKKCQALPRGSVDAFAFANAGVLQIAGQIAKDKYIVGGRNAEETPNGRRLIYTPPPGATHGPITTIKLSRYGERFGRDERGRWGPLKPSDVAQVITHEKPLFVKGKFVGRSGAMEAFAKELSQAGVEQHGKPGTTLAIEPNPRDSRSDLLAEIDKDGRGILTITGGYRAAEVGSRGRLNGVKGWWRALRGASGRWGTLIRKRYPELISLGAR